jgi:hypothetical protein
VGIGAQSRATWNNRTMPKMTKPLLAKLAKLEHERDFATNVVYAAAAPRNDVRFNDCYAMATEPVQQAYQFAIATLESFRQDMINEGRGYRCASFGHFTPNWR